MMNTTANTNATNASAQRVNGFCKSVTALAEKEVRIRTAKYEFLTDFDRSVLRDQIVEKTWPYFDRYDPAVAKLGTLVSRIARNTIVDYVDRWMHNEAVFVSLDRMLGWTGNTESDKDSYAAPLDIYQKAAEDFRDSETEMAEERSEWEEETRRTLARKLSMEDLLILNMLEKEYDREDMAEVLGCTRNAVDKRVHDFRIRAQKALGCRVVRSRKTHRETAESSVDLPVLFLWPLVG